jgi:CDP-glucose 4,6-dehydratase
MRRDRFYHLATGFETAFGGRYHGKRVLVTGHTGFKGSWLALWLRMMGAEVFGFALPPNSNPNHWSLLDLNVPEVNADLRDAKAVQAALHQFEPEIIFHLAAQPLVRRGYRDPMNTWGTNLMGLVNLFEAVRNTPSVRAIVNVTSDKCYEQRGARKPFQEDDPLGGRDPYSASKACAELLSLSYRASYFNVDDGRGHRVALATARAGNVIGGGDWGEDRLVPDLVRGVTRAAPTPVRNPQATRPWQHVLEPLSGYLLLGQLLLDNPEERGEPWNFGPDASSHIPVQQLIEHLARCWPAVNYELDTTPQPHEAPWLALDCSKAQEHLKWQPVWDIETTLARTAQWYRRLHQHGEVCSMDDLRTYTEKARELNLTWAV